VSETVLSLVEVTALEAAYVEQGRPALLAPRSALAKRWEHGHRDRETALRLVFLDWYSCSEPDFLTGMPEIGATEASLFPECSEHLLALHGDNEVGFALGWMMRSFPYCCGSMADSDAAARGERLWSEHTGTGRTPAPSVFLGRGAYGMYFAHIATRQQQRDS
jgi:hypothetical protein